MRRHTSNAADHHHSATENPDKSDEEVGELLTQPEAARCQPYPPAETTWPSKVPVQDLLNSRGSCPHSIQWMVPYQQQVPPNYAQPHAQRPSCALQPIQPDQSIAELPSQQNTPWPPMTTQPTWRSDQPDEESSSAPVYLLTVRSISFKRQFLTAFRGVPSIAAAVTSSQVWGAYEDATNNVRSYSYSNGVKRISLVDFDNITENQVERMKEEFKVAYPHLDCEYTQSPRFDIVLRPGCCLPGYLD